VKTDGQWHFFQVPVYLDELDPEGIMVELFAEPNHANEAIRERMARGEQLVAARGFNYSARVPASRPAADYTPRVVPFHPAAKIPLEEAHILWHR
jgi:starch phosphorylase